jgi:hypothetical protein
MGGAAASVASVAAHDSHRHRVPDVRPVASRAGGGGLPGSGRPGTTVMDVDLTDGRDGRILDPGVNPGTTDRGGGASR